MFRSRQKYRSGKCMQVISFEQQTLETGEIIDKMVDKGKEKLPDYELFDLKDMLKAGIQPEEVNSKIMRDKAVDINKVVRKYTKKTSKKVEENEQE